MEKIVDLNQVRAERAVESEIYSQAITAQKALIAKLEDAGDPGLSQAYSELASLHTKLNRSLAREAKEAAQEAKRTQAQDIDYDELEAHLRDQVVALIEEHRLVYVKKLKRFFTERPGYTDENGIYVPTEWTPYDKGSLCLLHVDLEPKRTNEFWRMFQDVMRDTGRQYDNTTYSFRPQPKTTLNMLRANFLQPQAGEVHWLFDALIRSLGGGKGENIEHLEKVLVAKWNNPANYLLPCQVFDDKGSTGKTLFASTVLVTLFGAELVVPSVDIGSLNGFNAHIAAKAVVFINEVSQEQQDVNALKRVLGSPTLRIEHKGIDATFADNTPLYFISGNNKGVGAVRFENSGVDRRYSMHCPTEKLHAYVLPHLTPADIAAFDPKRDLTKPVNEEEAEAWIRNVGQDILRDPNEVARWLNSLLNRHGAIRDVPALHGEDYRAVLAGQRSTHEAVFDLIFLDPAFRYIKRRTLFEFFKEEAEKSNMKNETFYKLCDEWLARNNVGVTLRKAVKWGTSSADVYVATSHTGKITNNDFDYYDTEFGRRTWKVELS